MLSSQGVMYAYFGVLSYPCSNPIKSSTQADAALKLPEAGVWITCCYVRPGGAANGGISDPVPVVGC